MHTLDYEFTDKQISPWGGGLRIIQEFFERSELKEIISLPLILKALGKYSRQKYSWLDKKKLSFEGATYS